MNLLLRSILRTSYRLLVRRGPALLIGLAVVGGLCLLIRFNCDSFETFIEHETRLRGAQQAYPVLAFFVGVMVYTVACYVPGTSGKAFVCGWLFGWLWGTVIINIASIVAALAVFLVTRYLLRDWISSRFRYGAQLVNRILEEDGAVYLLSLRMIPLVPYTLLNPTMAMINMRAKTFWWASQLGMLPGNRACAYAGPCVPNLRNVVDEGPASLLQPELLVALTILGLLPIAARGFLWAIRRARTQAAQEVVQ